MGAWHIGVRSDTESTDEIVRGFLARYLVGDDEAPANYSLVLACAGAKGAPRRLNMLFRSATTLTRSRSASRVLRSLGAYLASHAEGATDDGLLELDAVAALGVGGAVLMPSEVRTFDLGRFEGMLRRGGFALVDAPSAKVDPATGELVVSPPLLELDESVLDSLGAGMAGTGEVVPGRYPLVAWGFPWPEEGDLPLARAAALAPAMSKVLRRRPGDTQATAEMVAAVLRRVVTVPLSWDASKAAGAMARACS